MLQIDLLDCFVPLQSLEDAFSSLIPQLAPAHTNLFHFVIAQKHLNDCAWAVASYFIIIHDQFRKTVLRSERHEESFRSFATEWTIGNVQ